LYGGREIAQGGGELLPTVYQKFRLNFVKIRRVQNFTKTAKLNIDDDMYTQSDDYDKAGESDEGKIQENSDISVIVHWVTRHRLKVILRATYRSEDDIYLRLVIY